MKTLQVLAALSLLLAVVAPAHADLAAVDEAPECRGMPATVVGDPETPEAEIWGTEGDDVIVTNGVWKVYGYGGNDTICVTGDGYLQIWGYEGNDIVDASALPVSSSVTAYLGDGDDAFVGHDGADTVVTDPGPHSDEAGLGEDTVQTGGGPDIVETGTEGFPDEDTIDMGGGADFIKMMGTSARPITIIGGSGRDAVSWPWSAGPRQWTFDNRQGQVTRGGAVVAQITGLEDFDLLPLSNHDVSFVGSDRAEAVRVTRYFGAQTGTIQAALAGGDDQIWVNAFQQLDLDGGSGSDTLDYRRYNSRDPAVTMDLRAGTVTRGGTVIARGTDFEDALLEAPQQSRLIGTADHNDLVLWSCRGRIDGLGGNDRLSTPTKGHTCSGSSVEGAQLHGGSGDDRLFGGVYRDRLYGGPGSDVADGGPSWDLCRTERRYVRPVVHCLLAHDLAFMPHGENLVLVLRDGVPVRALMKDIGEEVAVMGEQPLPPDVERIRVKVTDEVKALALLTDVFDGFLRHLSAILDTDGVLPQEEFWVEVGRCVADHAAEHPELASAAASYDLFREEFDHSCLNRLQLRNTLQMVDLTDQAESLLYAGTLVNPIAAHR